MKLLFLSLWFQVLWLLAVLGQQEFQGMFLLCVAMTLIATFNQWRAAPIAAVAVIGITLDTINNSTQLLLFEQGRLPLWLMGLWILFGWYCYTLRHLLYRFPIQLVGLFGAVGGTMSYFAGYKLGAVSWSYGLTLTFAILLSEWFLLSIAIHKIINAMRVKQ